MHKNTTALRFFFLLLLAACSDKDQVYEEEAKQVKIERVFLIGDSTCSNYPNLNYPMTGWGTSFKAMAEGLQVFNYAISGKSSKSFYEEGAVWKNTLRQLKKGDFVFIQFGHNDQGDNPTKSTKPYTSYQSYLQKYIDEVRNKEAYPLLLTSINRNYWLNDNELENTLGEFPAAMKELAEREGMFLIDLHFLSKIKYEALGKEYTTDNLFMNLKAGEHENYPDGYADNIHLQKEGAKVIAAIVIEELEKMNLLNP